MIFLIICYSITNNRKYLTFSTNVYFISSESFFVYYDFISLNSTYTHQLQWTTRHLMYNRAVPRYFSTFHLIIKFKKLPSRISTRTRFSFLSIWPTSRYYCICTFFTWRTNFALCTIYSLTNNHKYYSNTIIS